MQHSKGMKKVIISGASDDLIDISGAISEEVSYSGSQTKISASDGTVAYIELTDAGNWDIHLTTSGNALEKVVPWNKGLPHTDEDCDANDTADYSDALVFNKPLDWVKIGRFKIKNMQPVVEEEDVEETFCPECLEPTPQAELDMFGGLCEECNIDQYDKSH